jgi:histidyl-tRNA synthetase
MAKNTNKIEPRLLKGFRDYNAAEQAARQEMFAKIQTVFERFGFAPLSTPVLEYKEILMGKYGEEGDRLIYSFKDNGDRDVAMRYDLTVPLARYVAQNLGQLALPFKRYQIAPVWRADNPQRGRLREFYQCDVDAVGAEGSVSDAEVVACICQALEAVGITEYEVRLNNRALFELIARSFLDGGGEDLVVLRAMDKADKIGGDGVLKFLADQKVSDDAMKFAQLLLDAGTGSAALDKLADEVPDSALGVAEVRKLISLIAAQGVAEEKIIFSPSTVRGLDYYTGMVCEIMLKNNPEFGSIAGGGRYDKLLETFSDTSVPAVGISIGVDRLFEAMEALGLIKPGGSAKVLVMNLDENLAGDYVTLANELRSKGIATEVYYQAAKLDKQFKYAESRGIQYAVIMGTEEKEKGMVQLKDLSSREQKIVKLGDLGDMLGN